ncbi:glycine betaine ABC transporter substrate-binding protein [Saxibacter everestensis]|uniref:Glycine betaine ABC transporter substrate-binding protein n=1 Tax=Saxibacter everestensis TaxID=2909229 RepID=A0ABY8QRC1_9MICO|nr:glycine betaine ABC transporter substrate-binding protein [Brevibacteriaceae bacterium ZFBP1038]
MREFSRRALLRSGALATASLALAGCAGQDKPGPSDAITVGSKGFAESWITGELYAQALRALGLQVTLKTNVGSSEIIDQALTSGQIDLYPEYTGVIVMSLAGREELLATGAETYQVAKEFEASRGVTLLEATPFENKNAIAVTKAFADEHGLKTIDDLRGIGDFVYSTYPDNVSGGQGYEAIVREYRLPNMKLKTLSIGLNYQAIERGEIQAADVFTTDPQLLRSDLVVLEDTLNLFGFQNVAPAIRSDVLERHGSEVSDVLNRISELLTLEAIQTMNAASAVNRLDPSQVAKMFLDANDLL